MTVTREQVKQLAFECGFELAGVAEALPAEDYSRFDNWRDRGFAGEMQYLTDRRGDLRADPRHLLPSARSLVCVAKVYNPGENYQTNSSSGRIARYAVGPDYHDVLRKQLETLVERIRDANQVGFEFRICVDTAPLLERTYARLAGLGWIGRNTCLINQRLGSWFFLGEILLSLPLPPDQPAANRCGTCTRCIDACPTDAIVKNEANGWSLDSRLCISYLTIEKRGEIAEDLEKRTQNYVFGCDICQEVCPWNRRAAETVEPSFSPGLSSALLEEFAAMSEGDFREAFRRTPVWRAKYAGFLRNVALALGNSGNEAMREPLLRLASHTDPVVAATAGRALATLERSIAL